MLNLLKADGLEGAEEGGMSRYPGGVGGENERVSQTFQPSGRFAASNS